MPRGWIHPWWNADSSRNLQKWRFSDPRRSLLCRMTATAFANGKVETREKLGYPSENLTFQDGGWLPPNSENLDLTWGIPNWEIPTRKNTSDTYEVYAMQKAYSPMHGSAWPFRQLRPLPKFLFGGRSTSGLDTWHGLTQRVTLKNFGGNPPKGTWVMNFRSSPL